LLTVFAWWWSRRPEEKTKEREPPPIYKQQAKFLKAARRAALSGDAAIVKSALLSWGRLQWPNDYALCSASYGPGGDDPARGDSWNGEILAKALRSFAVNSNDTKDAGTDDLPSLMPGSPA
jgi:hypothetical protein